MSKKLVLIAFAFIMFIPSIIWAELYTTLKIISTQCNIYRNKDINSQVLFTLPYGNLLIANDIGGDWWQIILNNKNSNFPAVGYVYKNANEVEASQELDLYSNSVSLADYVRTTYVYGKYPFIQDEIDKFAGNIENGDYKDALISFNNIDAKLANEANWDNASGITQEQIIKDSIFLFNLFLQKYYLFQGKDTLFLQTLFKRKYELIFRGKDKTEIQKMINSFENEYSYSIKELRKIKESILQK